VSSIKLEYVVKALPGRQYRAWQLRVSALDALNGDDPGDVNVFVLRINKTVSGDVDVFSHVASLYEMRNTPSSRADIPPKAPGFYRTSVLLLDFQNRHDVDSAIDAIRADVLKLMTALSSDSGESPVVVDVP